MAAVGVVGSLHIEDALGVSSPHPLSTCREWNYKFGSNFGLFGSGRGFNRRSAPIGSIWAEFQLKWSHGDPFRDPNHALVRPVLPWY